MADRPRSGPTDYLAAERTFLAWIRTGLALMGFGFVVARFGLFLQALQLGSPNFQIRAYGLSFWFGTALLLIGVLVNVLSAWNHLRLVDDLRRGGTAFQRPSVLAVAVAVILAMLGLAMAIYLVSVRDPKQEKIENQQKSMTPHPDHGIISIPSHQSVGRPWKSCKGSCRPRA
jgi:putative membrane protein